MLIYCLVSQGTSKGPKTAENKAALKILKAGHPGKDIQIAQQQDEVSCIYTANADGFPLSELEVAVKKAYDNSEFTYHAYRDAAAEHEEQLNIAAKNKTSVPSNLAVGNSSGGNANTKYSELTIPKSSKTNIEASKYFVFNTTGNIMMVSTQDSGQMSQSVQDVFAEVSVFLQR